LPNPALHRTVPVAKPSRHLTIPRQTIGVTDAAAATKRWAALDAFRGLAVIGMLLVNNPGEHDAVYRQFAHSQWNGCTIADLVFPFFLFAVGITTALGATKRGLVATPSRSVARIWRRAATIFAVGFVINWFPFYQSGPISFAGHPTVFDRIGARLLIVRIPGVLQRIAVAYLAVALLARRTSTRVLIAITVLLLLGYWALLMFAPVPGEAVIGAAVFNEPSRTIVAHVDRALFDWTRWGLGNHLWDSALTWDPEGALSTIASVATVALGYIFGAWEFEADGMTRGRTLVVAGLALTIVGWLWSFALPLNKSLWTSSYVVFTAGIAAIVLGALTLTAKGERRLWAMRPLIVFGENPLVAYAGSEIARRILHSSIKVRGATGRLGLDEWVSTTLEHTGWSPKAASLAWAILFLLAWWLLLERLSRRGLLVRA
jgi:predicted acyltransferase